MAHRGKAKNKTKPFRRNISGGTLASAIFITTTLLTLLSFISIPATIIVLGAMLTASLFYTEKRRRFFQEQASFFKFKILKNKQDILERTVKRNAQSLKELKNDLEETKKHIESIATAIPQPESPMIAQSRQEKPQRTIPADFHDFIKTIQKEDSDIRATRQHHRDNNNSTMPRALKPGQDAPKPVEQNIIQNHRDPESEFEDISDTIIRELVHLAIENNRIDVFVQPIVRLPQRQPRYYEMFSRIRARAGQYIPASRYMKLAEQDNRQNDIDNLLLLHCLKTLQESAHIEQATPFFLNITNETLKNGAFMKRLLHFIAQNRNLAERMIFELPQNQILSAPAPHQEIIKGLGRLGCTFSIDHTTNLDFDIPMLQSLKIKFIKIGAREMLATHNSERQIIHTNRTKRKLESNGINIIVERIENEQQIKQLLDFDLQYGQGHLFGRPEPQGAYADRTRVRRTGLPSQQ